MVYDKILMTSFVAICMDYRYLVLIFPILGWFFVSAADRVFGPATTTRHVYDVAAQHVVSGAMQGINGKSVI